MNPYKKLENRGLLLIVIIPAMFIAVLVLLQWPQWWKWTIFERTPMTWLQSVMLVCCSLAALCGMSLCMVNNHRDDCRLYLVLGLGFAYLALDERFALHERLRDKFLAQHDITLPLFPWVAAGNFVLLLFLIAGMAALPWIMKLFRRRKAKSLFIAGVSTAAVAVLMDSFEFHQYSLAFQRLQQFVEEVLETTAMALFLSALFLTLTAHLQQLNSQSTGPEHNAGLL